MSGTVVVERAVAYQGPQVVAVHTKSGLADKLTNADLDRVELNSLGQQLLGHLGGSCSEVPHLVAVLVLVEGSRPKLIAQGSADLVGSSVRLPNVEMGANVVGIVVVNLLEQTGLLELNRALEQDRTAPVDSSGESLRDCLLVILLGKRLRSNLVVGVGHGFFCCGLESGCYIS